MTKIIFITFILLLQLKVEAQNRWIEYLKNIKTQFYYKDTIAVKFHDGIQLDPEIKLVKVDSNHQFIFKSNEDTLTEEGGATSEKYFYSIYLSKMNYATIVLYSEGNWAETGNLYLYNFSPKGKLLVQIKLLEGWGDAGESYIGNSKFVNDSILNVMHAVGFEKADQNYNYQITEWDYLIMENGIIQQKSIRKYEKNGKLLDYDNRVFR